MNCPSRPKSLLALPVLFATCLSNAPPVLADEPGQIPETVVVTATRTEQPLALTGTSMSIITAADLTAEQTLVLSDALAETPGLTMNRTGGIGQPTGISIRGAETGQTLVLIDGVRINDPSATDDGAVLGDLLVNNISRVEILRGPQSTLYGSDAIGGVVNILTQRGGDTPFGLVASAEGGSLSTFRINAAVNGTVDAVDYGGAVNYFDTAGIAAADSRGLYTQPDGYRNFGATENLRWHVSDTISLDLRTYYTQARDAFDGYPPPNYTLAYTGEFGDDRLFAGYAGINWSLFDGHFQNRFAVTETASDRKDFNPSLSVPEEFYAEGNAQQFEYQGIVDFTAQDQMTFGADLQHTTLNTGSPSPYLPNPPPIKGHTQIDGYYAQYQRTLFDQLTLTGGLRYTDDEEFGSHTSFKLAGAWALFDGTTVLRADYGDGFKAPSLYEIYSPYSNPLGPLAPESARGWEVGADQHFLDDRVQASLTYFERKTTDQIDFFDCYGVVSQACTLRENEGGYYYNVGRAEAKGVELDVSAKLDETLVLGVNYTNQTAIDLATGYDLAREPHLMANARLVWTPTKVLSLGASVGFTGHRFDDAYDSVPLSSFALVNLFGSYDVTEQIELYARVQNLFEPHYELAAGYNAMPRTFAGGIRLKL